MKTIARLNHLVLCLLLLNQTAFSQVDLSKYTLTFSDDFTGTSLDLTKWSNSTFNGDEVINNELQHYWPENVFVTNGLLRLMAERRTTTKSGVTQQYASGEICTFDRYNNTNKTFVQKFGYFEMSAKVPKGTGLWPAFWLLPVVNTWPPEIDIMEIIGSEINTVYMTNHYGTWPNNSKQGSSYTGPDFSAGFHKFAIDWTANYIRWYVDGVLRFEVTANVPQQEMFIILNLAVGGDWPGAPDANTPFPSYYEVDYVKAYQCNSPCGGSAAVCPTYSGTNLVSNGGFENGLTSWRVSAGTAVSQTTNVLCGSYSAKIGGRSRNGLEQTITGLQPNTTYTVQARGKVGAASVTGKFGVKSFGGTTIEKSFVSTSYTSISTTFTTGATNTSAVIYGWNSTGDYIYLDAVHLAVGTETQSGIERGNISRETVAMNQLKVNPNPAQRHTRINYFSDRNELATIVLSDMTSKKLYVAGKFLNAGTNIIDLNVSKFKPGIYIISVTTKSGKNATERLIISKN